MRRFAQIAVLVVVIAAAALAVIHLRARHDVTAAEAKPSAKVVEPPPKAIEVIPLAEPQPQPAVPAPPFDPDDAAAFATLADASVAELHESITLEQWTKSQDKIEDWQPSKDEASYDCRTLVKTETLASGRKIKHAVYFYPPEAPTPAVFPAASGEDLLNRSCLLGMVRVQTAASTDRDGHGFERALQEQFVKKHGESIGMKGTEHPWGPSESARWIAASNTAGSEMAGAEIVSAYDTHPRPTLDELAGGAVFVFARLPIVHEIELDSCCRVPDHHHAIEESQFHLALGIAAADAGLTERVATLFAHLFGTGLEMPPDLDKSREAVLPTVRDWLKAVKSLPPARRAAGLYVADQLLVVASNYGWQQLILKENAELRSAFEKIGASFTYNELGGCYEYSQNWLDQARELDPEGPVGQMAVLVSLARGSAPKLPKDKGKELDIFHGVISDGEWLLSKKPDPATAAQIHFIIGDAYSDIVALAGGAERDYGDPKEYEPEAPSARVKALEHYRAGLAADGTSENAKRAWLQAWHISAGLLPTTRYVYIGD